MQSIQSLNQYQTIGKLQKFRVLFRVNKQNFLFTLPKESLPVINAYYKIYETQYNLFMDLVRQLSEKQISRNYKYIHNIHHLYINILAKIHKIRKSKMDKPRKGVFTEIPYDGTMAKQKVNLIDLFRTHYETWDLTQDKSTKISADDTNNYVQHKFIKISADDTITSEDWENIKRPSEFLNTSEVA